MAWTAPKVAAMLKASPMAMAKAPQLPTRPVQAVPNTPARLPEFDTAKIPGAYVRH